MKPIIILIAMAIAGTGLGVGFLTAPQISVTSQDVGVGETTLTAPVSTVDVDLHITAVKGNQNFFKNQYDRCMISSDDPIVSGSTIFCKLTNDGKVVAEGSRKLTNNLPAGTPTHVTIDKTITAGSNYVTNVNDLTIVVQGP